jgi:hypothetical protein
MASGQQLVARYVLDSSGIKKGADDADAQLSRLTTSLQAVGKTGGGAFSPIASAMSSTFAQGNPLEEFLGRATGGISALGDKFAKLEKDGASSVQKIGVGLAGLGGIAAGIGGGLALASSPLTAATDQLKQAITDAGGNWDEFEVKTEQAKSKLKDFASGTEVENSLATLTTSLHDPALAYQYLGETADIAAVRHMSLSEAATAVGRAFTNPTRLARQFGDSVTSSTKTQTEAKKATDEHTKAVDALAKAQQAVTADEAKAQAAAQALTLAQQNLTVATDTNQKAQENLAAVQTEVGQVMSRTGAYATQLATDQQSVADASTQLGNAQDNLATIQQRVNDVMNDAGTYAEDLQKAQLGVAHAALTQKEAVDRVAKAQADLMAAQKTGDHLKVTAAQDTLANAQLSVKDAALTAEDAQTKLTSTQNEAIPGTLEYEKNQRALADAHNQVAKAQQTQIDAQAKYQSELNVSTPGTAAYRAEQQKLLDAQYQAQAAASKLTDAQVKVHDAQGKVADSNTTLAAAHAAVSAAQDKVTSSTAAMNAAVAAAQSQLQTFQQLMDTIATQTHGQFQAATDNTKSHVTGMFHEVEDKLQTFGQAWGGTIAAAGIAIGGAGGLADLAGRGFSKLKGDSGAAKTQVVIDTEAMTAEVGADAAVMEGEVSTLGATLGGLGLAAAAAFGAYELAKPGHGTPGAKGSGGGGPLSLQNVYGDLGMHQSPAKDIAGWWDSLFGGSSPKVPAHGTGGITTRPHLAVVGDTPEAIIPLSKMNDVLPGATGGGGTTVVNVTVNVAGSVQTEKDLVAAVHQGLLETGQVNSTLFPAL